MPNFIEIGGVTRKPLVDLTWNDPYVLNLSKTIHYTRSQQVYVIYNAEKYLSNCRKTFLLPNISLRSHNSISRQSITGSLPSRHSIFYKSRIPVSIPNRKSFVKVSTLIPTTRIIDSTPFLEFRFQVSALISHDRNAGVYSDHPKFGLQIYSLFPSPASTCLDPCSNFQGPNSNFYSDF